ncbi:HBL376Cp [Eremothecium sinecaudum]|uniref:HBL376Cp n=1 Tax=Eremothecium sinecaudum TaxID=45286 RepID=A0A120K0P9_9SACH|nr:HBL376Cp [Eremothecium sinecaudum]AMD18526.1 HBL376Cp [Eremothecium sinecaudum]
MSTSPTKSNRVTQDSQITLPPISSFDNLIRAASEHVVSGSPSDVMAAVAAAPRYGPTTPDSLLSYQLSTIDKSRLQIDMLSLDNQNYFLSYGNGSNDRSNDQKTHKPRKKKKCPICHNYYANLSTHKSTHLDPGARPYKCEVCTRGFARSNDMQRHKKRHWKGELFAPQGGVKGADAKQLIQIQPLRRQTVLEREDLIAQLQTHIPRKQLETRYLVQGTYKCPFNSTLIKLDMEIFPSKDRPLPFATSTCHITGVFSRCDTYKNHLKALHFEYPPGTKKRERANIHGRCKHCGAMFDNVDIWLNEHVGKICGYFYH